MSATLRRTSSKYTGASKGLQVAVHVHDHIADPHDAGQTAMITFLPIEVRYSAIACTEEPPHLATSMFGKPYEIGVRCTVCEQVEDESHAEFSDIFRQR